MRSNQDSNPDFAIVDEYVIALQKDEQFRVEGPKIVVSMIQGSVQAQVEKDESLALHNYALSEGGPINNMIVTEGAHILQALNTVLIEIKELSPYELGDDDDDDDEIASDDDDDDVADASEVIDHLDAAEGRRPA